MKVQQISTTAIMLAEFSHIACCGLPIFVAIMSAGSQVGLGGAFTLFHEHIHHYELVILAGSGLLLALGLGLHYASYQINCRTTGCEGSHGDCAPKKFRVGWVFTIALVLYAVNLTVYIFSGHGVHHERFH